MVGSRVSSRDEKKFKEQMIAMELQACDLPGKNKYVEVLSKEEPTATGQQMIVRTYTLCSVERGARVPQ